MSREKQIEEMATKMLIEVNRAGNEVSFKNLATVLYNAGYRKASDLAEEIFELIDCAFSPVLVYNGYTVKEYLAELKKKYTKEE